MNPLPTTHAEMAAFIAGFERGTVPKEDWTHGAHVLAGAWYVHGMGEEAALEHMRIRVRSYNEAVGGKNTETSGYHETITVFWIKLIEAFRQQNATLSQEAFTNAAVAHFGKQRDIFRRYYSFDVIGSTPARLSWTPPDLLSIK